MNHAAAMLRDERHARICQALESDGSVRVTELARTLNVDPVTVRRDLDILERQGRLQRVHGGALRREAQPTGSAPSALERRIAEAAARFIPDRSVIFLGPGALVQEIVPFLQEHIHLTLITNALNTAWSVARQQRHTLHVIGGQVEPDFGMVSENEALTNIRADWIVWEAEALDAERGLTHDRRELAVMARVLFQLGAQVMLLARPESLGRTGALSIAPADEVDVLITGREADTAVLWDLSELGIRVILA